MIKTEQIIEVSFTQIDERLYTMCGFISYNFSYLKGDVEVICDEPCERNCFRQSVYFQNGLLDLKKVLNNKLTNIIKNTISTIHFEYHMPIEEVYDIVNNILLSSIHNV